MSLRQYNFCIILFLLPVLFSCSTTKKGFINQEYHTLTTKYNVLFNGKEAFLIGEAILGKAFEDNFFELLPVEPINLRGENIDKTTIVPGFDRAEEKAVKGIQKHSMNINEVQYNRQIDESYLLLGKARYFDRRFFPALEAFNFILESGANKTNFTKGKIWREKTNIRLKNYELAIENLRPLARALLPKSKNFSHANATLADAFINLKEHDSAAFYIKRAALKEPKRKNKARYLYITGQLFEALKKRDSALWAYGEIIALKRKAPRKFLIQGKIKETLLDTTINFEERVGFLEKMLKNYENQVFEHTITRALAKLYFKQNRDSIALDYLDQSLASPFLDSYTEIENYQDLADFHYEQGNYLTSGEYLEELLQLFDKTSVTYKKLKRKKDNLADVISYEKKVQKTDSIIGLFSLSVEEQLAYFENFINKKMEREALKIKEENEEKSFQLLSRTKTSFYFYNPNQVLSGRQIYLANWGNRPNVDNWRRANAIMNLNKGEIKSEESIIKSIIIQETPESFMAELPQTKKEKDSLILVNQKAYLQLGMIYKEKFNDFKLAHKRLESTLSLNPPDEIAVQALYHLFRIDENEAPLNAEGYKKELIQRFPNTPFARLLLDPENYDLSGIVTPQSLYARAFSLFEDQKFLETLKEIELLTVLASGSQIEPKISLLRAHTIGRLYGINAWKEALTEVATNFSAVQEGIKAKELVDKIKKQNNLKEIGVIYKNYKWIFPFSISETKKTKTFFVKIKRHLTDNNKLWSVSLDTYNQDYVFVVVHGIRDPKEIDNWKAKYQTEFKLFEDNENFVTLASQYRDYIKNKTWSNTSK